MDKKVVIIGLGEMGGVFARGFLRIGMPVYPVTRTMNIQQAVEAAPNPELVVLAVAEADLHPVLNIVPAQWRDKLLLLQNELLPRDWEAHALPNPTVISVWFEKKKGQDVKVLLPSPVYGPAADMVQKALGSLDIPVKIVASAEALEHELVLKNVYILTTNIAGLECGGDVESLWKSHNDLARDVAGEVMDIQEWLTGRRLNREKLMEDFATAIHADPAHKCMGRSAPARLQRALKLADEAGLAVPKLREIAAKHLQEVAR